MSFGANDPAQQRLILFSHLDIGVGDRGLIVLNGWDNGERNLVGHTEGDNIFGIVDVVASHNVSYATPTATPSTKEELEKPERERKFNLLDGQEVRALASLACFPVTSGESTEAGWKAWQMHGVLCLDTSIEQFFGSRSEAILARAIDAFLVELTIAELFDMMIKAYSESHPGTRKAARTMKGGPQSGNQKKTDQIG